MSVINSYEDVMAIMECASRFGCCYVKIEDVELKFTHTSNPEGVSVIGPLASNPELKESKEIFETSDKITEMDIENLTDADFENLALENPLLHEEMLASGLLENYGEPHAHAE